MSSRRSVLMRSRGADLLSFQIRFVARPPYRARSAEKSSSGSYISRAVLAAVLPRLTRPASSRATRSPLPRTARQQSHRSLHPENRDIDPQGCVELGIRAGLFSVSFLKPQWSLEPKQGHK